MNHRANQTQAEIARKMGVTQTDVSRIENKEMCTLPMFQSYLKACGKEMIITPKADVLKQETITGLKMRVIKLLAEKQECARNLMKQAVKMEGLQTVTEQ
jgi:transcriptional regulator with XRE-family HTH domain